MDFADSSDARGAVLERFIYKFNFWSSPPQDNVMMGNLDRMMTKGKNGKRGEDLDRSTQITSNMRNIPVGRPALTTDGKP
jgi:hypothetical protein